MIQVTTHGFSETIAALKKEQALIKANAGKATKAYAEEVAKVAMATAPRRTQIPTPKTIARRSTSTLSPEPMVRANLARHVRVYQEGPGRGNVSETSAKVKLTGHVWHLITGDVRPHEERAGRFRGRASGRRAIQMLDGYAARAMHPGHSGHHGFLQEAKLAAHVAGLTRARAALRKP